MMVLQYLLKRGWHIFIGAGLFILIRESLTYLSYLVHSFWQDIRWYLWVRRTSTPLVTTTIFNMQMQLHRNDKGISRELAIYHVHEPLGTQLLEKFVEEGMVVVDVGANIGYYALMESKLVGQKGQVIAIEAMLENTDMLNINLRLNNVQNVTVINAAISDSDGKGTLYLSERSNWPSLKQMPWHSSTGAREIDTWKLDTLLEQLKVPAHLVQMDVEGFEIEAFAGMTETLRKYKPRLVVEMHTPLVGRQPIIDLLQVLKTFGYNVRFIVDRAKDFPWNKSGHGIKSMNIDRLLISPGPIGAEKIFTVFLE